MSRRAFLLAVIAFGAAPALAQQQYVVGEQRTGNAYRLMDLNGDGDALDAGEKTLWAAGLGELIDLRRLGSAILAVNRSAGTISFLRDINGDGDCLDAGENVLWASGFTSGFGLTVGRGGVVYAADYGRDGVYRLVDRNGDGDVLDAGESVLYAQGLGGAVSVLATHSGLYVAGYNAGAAYKLLDLNGDGDALDAGEVVAYTPSTIPTANGLLAGRGGKVFVGSRTGNTAYVLEDTNGDGDAMDVAETLSYADGVYGGISGPWGMAPHAAGGFLLGQYTGNRISLVRDLDGDGDALDVGEGVIFADGIASPTGLEALRGPGATMITILNGTGTLDVGKPNFYAIVDGSTVGRAAVSTCLEAGMNVLISTDNPYGFEAGTIYQDPNGLISKTRGPDAALTLRADDGIHLWAGIASSSGKLAVTLSANDPSLAYRDTDANAGDVAVMGPITTNGGTFTASGVNFLNYNSGAVHTGGGAVAVNVTGYVLLMNELLAGAGDLSVTAPQGIWLEVGRLGGTGTVHPDVYSWAGTIDVPSGQLALAGTAGLMDSGWLAKTGGGKLRLTGPQIWGNSSVVDVQGGTLTYSMPGGSVTVGAGSKLVIEANATVEVAGSTDPFTDWLDANRHVDIENDGLLHLYSGSDVAVGHIVGTDANLLLGTVVIDAGATLYVTNLVQDSVYISGILVLGGVNDDTTNDLGSAAIPQASEAVPEPAMLVLVGAGMISLLRRRRPPTAAGIAVARGGGMSARRGRLMNLAPRTLSRQLAPISASAGRAVCLRPASGPATSRPQRL